MLKHAIFLCSPTFALPAPVLIFIAGTLRHAVFLFNLLLNPAGVQSLFLFDLFIFNPFGIQHHHSTFFHSHSSRFRYLKPHAKTCDIFKFPNFNIVLSLRKIITHFIIVRFAYHLIYRSYGAQILTINFLSSDM
jgi:hypothetical protein